MVLTILWPEGELHWTEIRELMTGQPSKNAMVGRANKLGLTRRKAKWTRADEVRRNQFA